MREMQPTQFAWTARAATPVLLLRELGGDRYLPIWIGRPEANAIALAASKSPAQRPQTHELIVNVIEALGQQLAGVIITALHGGTYHAELVFDHDVRVSARPSDAIAIALRTGAVIQAEDELIDQVGIPGAQLGIAPHTETTDYPDTQFGRGPKDNTEAQWEQLREFLEQTRPEDFGPSAPDQG
jgi:bifunctional DNase/RNase